MRGSGKPIPFQIQEFQNMNKSGLNLYRTYVHTVDDEQIANLCLSTSGTIFYPSKFLLILVLVDYHLYDMDLQNKILWFLKINILGLCQVSYLVQKVRS